MQDFCVIKPGEGSTIPLPLATMLVKAQDGDVAVGKIVGELTADPGFKGPGNHSHSSQAELFYVLEGEFSFEVEGEEIRLGPGTSILIKPDTVHNFANVSTAPARLVVIGAAEEIELYSSTS